MGRRIGMISSITKEEIKRKIERGENFKLVDVRNTPDYEAEHIKGAIHLLISEMREEKIAAEKFLDYGFTNIYFYPGSWQEWKKSGFPTEKGERHSKKDF
jgi:rhodanese-related sulfurtransferase